MKKRLFILLISFMILSCSKEEDPICCANYDVQVDILYLNEQGENWLENSTSLKASDIQVYHKIDSEWKTYFEGHQDYPNSLGFVELEGEKHLRVFLALETDTNNISETRLVFPDGREDILSAEIYINQGLTAVTKLWHEGELIWDNSGDTDRRISLVR